jgi:hypothetical protein
VSIQAAGQDVEVTNNGAVGASNMLDFEELSDIVRCDHSSRHSLKLPSRGPGAAAIRSNTSAAVRVSPIAAWSSLQRQQYPHSTPAAAADAGAVWQGYEAPSILEQQQQASKGLITWPSSLAFLLIVYRMVNETDIVELELKSKRFSLSLKKKAALQAAEPIVQV